LKVQHKQIKRHDMHDRDSPDQFDEATPFQPRYALPPSGPNSNQHMWFDTAHSHSGEEEGAEQGQPQDGSSGTAADMSNAAASAGTAPGEMHMAGGPTPNDVNNGSSEHASPLANLGPLQAALPDIPGKSQQE
jgi:hypothetical protein